MKAYCPSYTTDINAIPLNVSSDKMYEVLRGFMAEMSTIFTDEFIHTGGDEVVVDCWMNDAIIAEWAKKNNLKNGYDIYAYFEKRLAQMVRPSKTLTCQRKPSAEPTYVNRTMVVWQDVFDDCNQELFHPETVVEVWRDKGTVKAAVSKGYRALYAYPYYLDVQSPGEDPKPKFYVWVDTWRAFYSADPTASLGLSPEQEKMVLGGEGAMWGETVDETNIESRIWPRASAIAERLWSAQSQNNADEAKPRLITFRCTSLARRGIGAGPIMQDYCPLPPRPVNL